jgi:hypothetical protein
VRVSFEINRIKPRCLEAIRHPAATHDFVNEYLEITKDRRSPIILDGVIG